MTFVFLIFSRNISVLQDAVWETPVYRIAFDAIALVAVEL
jgi:hypothetical protein